MAFKDNKRATNFSSLQQPLNNSGVNKSNNALFQVISNLIALLVQYSNTNDTNITDLKSRVSAIESDTGSDALDPFLFLGGTHVG